MSSTELSFGNETWRVEVPAEKRVELRRQDAAASQLSMHDQVRDALEKPFRFEPLRRALTPDDRVVIVVDETLPNVAEAVTAILEHLATAKIPSEAVTLLTLPGAQASGWIDELPDEFADVRTEVHDPADRKKLAYLATTKGGRRVYLNRTFLEADFTILLTGRRYDPIFGYAGAETTVFPLLSDEETRSVHRTIQRRGVATDPEAVEVAGLIGSAFFVQVIDDGAKALAVVGGLQYSTAEGASRQDAHWRADVAERPDTVVAVVSDPRATFADVAMAVFNVTRAVPPGGRIVVVAPPVALDGEGVTILRRHDEPTDAIKALAKAKPADWVACHLWAKAATRTRLFLANVDDDTAEELFATRVGNDRELQRLIDAAERVAVVPAADRTLLMVDR
jgi:nickel-dependent lactate racemase